MGSWSDTTILWLFASHMLVGFMFFRLGANQRLARKISYIEQRKFPRVRPPRSLRVEAQLMNQDFLEVVRVRDISEGGLGVTVPRDLAQTTTRGEVELILTLPSESPFKVRGTIRHGKRRRRITSSVGIVFSEMPDSDRAKIRAYVDKVRAGQRS